MAEIERELDWDDEISEESSFILLPEGEYEFEVTKVERGRYMGGDKLPPCNKATVTFAISTDKGTAYINRDFFLHTSTERFISEFYIAIGIKKRGEPCKMQWNQVLNKRGKCFVYIDEYQKKKDGKPQNDKNGNPIMLETNKIKYFIEPPEINNPAPAKSYSAGDF